MVAGGGFGGPQGWAAHSARITGGKAILQKSGEFKLARLMQKVTGLEPDSRYVLSLRLRAEQAPDADVVADLVGPGYESARRRLAVTPEQILPRFKTFEKVVPTETPPDSVMLRVFTTSTVPVTVDDVSLTKLD